MRCIHANAAHASLPNGEVASIPVISAQAEQRLIELLESQPQLQAVWLCGISRAQSSISPWTPSSSWRTLAPDGRRGRLAGALAGGFDPAP
jgi:hypothetical protein